MMIKKRTSVVAWLATLAAGLGCPTAAPAVDLEEARSLLLRGRYEESAEAYTSLLEKETLQATLGLARCRLAVGESAEAVKLLTAAIEKQPGKAELHAELAAVAFDLGDHEA